MKSLVELYETPFEDIQRHLLAGVFAQAGDIEVALRIMSAEGDIVYVSEIRQGLLHIRHEQIEPITNSVLSRKDINAQGRQIYCLALSGYGNLKAITGYVSDTPALWDFIIDDLPGKEDDDVCEFALATKDNRAAERCLRHLVTQSFPSPLIIERVLRHFPEIRLTQKHKDLMIKAAVSGHQSPEEVTACERLAGRELTESERARYLKNSFRERIEMDVKTALDWVWEVQNRSFTKQERRLLMKDARETLFVRSRK